LKRQVPGNEYLITLRTCRLCHREAKLQDSYYISAALFKLLFQNWVGGAVIDLARVAALNGFDGVLSIINLM
jgi:hypothetical protein